MAEARRREQYLEQQRARIRREEAATEDLLRRTTTPCPSCGRRIEKTGGCNHVQCGNPHAGSGARVRGGCGHHFHWCCLRPYPAPGHDVHGACPFGGRAG